MSIPTGMPRRVAETAYIYLEDKLKVVFAENEREFRCGEVVIAGGKVPFDAGWIGDQIGWAAYAVSDALKRMAADPTSHIVLRWKTAENPDVIHIDTVVLEFLNKHQFELIMEYAEREVVTDKGPTTVSGPFDAAFIAWKLGLNINPVACALRRLAANPENFIRLANTDPNNPKPIRDYGASPPWW